MMIVAIIFILIMVATTGALTTDAWQQHQVPPKLSHSSSSSSSTGTAGSSQRRMSTTGDDTHQMGPCTSHEECQQWLQSSSTTCNFRTGTCTNPFTMGGCLYQRRRRSPSREDSSSTDNTEEPINNKKRRVCSSMDPVDAVERGYCRKSEWDHMEIRIKSQNWDSVFFQGWILQILLSEVLDVPVTMETGRSHMNIDFYNLDNSYDYGESNDWTCLQTASQVGDCRKVTLSNDNHDPNYVSCCHFVVEVWDAHLSSIRKLAEQGVVENPMGVGILGHQSWFVPRITGIRDPTLLTYLGLMGEENRRKLAERFLRPTRWGQYCEEVSFTNCSLPNSVAKRAPQDETERMAFFVEGLYTGHFRKTWENDCDVNPNCTGHFADFPCGWHSFSSQQLHHLNIALQSEGNEPGSRGYTQAELVEMWAAANATRSDLIIMWWSPEFVYQSYRGTDYEFLRVALQSTTKECIENRISGADRCSDNQTIRVGDPRGACDEEPQSIQKVLSARLLEDTRGTSMNRALHSPAYDVLKAFTMSSLDIGEIFRYWQMMDHLGIHSSREAVCQWWIDHEQRLRSFIPPTFPRTLQTRDSFQKEPMDYASVVVALFSMVLVGSSCMVTYHMRSRTPIRHAQIEFLFFLLLGLIMVSIAALLVALPPTNARCLSHAWLINIGYTLQLVPLVVKFAAMTQLMRASKRMKRVVIHRDHLVYTVAIFTALMSLFLLIWSVSDPPRKVQVFELTTKRDAEGSVIVNRNFQCESTTEKWSLIGIGWHCFLLFIAIVQTIQTRSIRNEVNEVQTLALVVYSHFFFVVLRLVLLLVQDSINDAHIAGASSIILGLNTIVTLIIYVIPKFRTKAERTPWNPSFFLNSSQGGNPEHNFDQSDIAQALERRISEQYSGSSSNKGSPAHGVTGRRNSDGNDTNSDGGDDNHTPSPGIRSRSGVVGGGIPLQSIAECDDDDVIDSIPCPTCGGVVITQNHGDEKKVVINHQDDDSATHPQNTN